MTKPDQSKYRCRADKSPTSTPQPAPGVIVSASPYLLVLLCGVIWGMTFSLARIATSGDAQPIGLSLWQAFGGSLVLLFFCLLRWRRPRLNRETFRHSAVIAIFGTAIPGTLYFYAASKVPAGILAITVALVPMMTYALSWMLRIDHFGRWRLLGIFMGFIAIVLLVAPDSSLPDPAMARWLILPLIASVFYTLESIYVDICIPQNADMMGLLTSGLMIAAIVLIPIVYLKDAFVPISLPLDRIEWAILAMTVVSSVAYVMFLYVVKLAGAVFASLTGYVITLAGVFWGIIFFAEQHSMWVWAALVLMLVGMILVTPRKFMPDIGVQQ